MQSLEKFESGWANDGFKLSFNDADLSTFGVTWTEFIRLDLTSGTVTTEGDFGGPPGGVVFVATVNTTIGGGLPATPVTGTYFNAVGAAISYNLLVPEGLAVNNCFFSEPITDGIVSINTAVLGTPHKSGKITLWGALTLAEIFTESFWGPPDVGL